MDAFLSSEAFQFLQALNLVASPSHPDGFLIGHKRGHRFLVEKILPSGKGFFPSLARYQELEEFYRGRLLGFFSFRPDERKLKKILVPFAFGKLYLELQAKNRKKIAMKSYVIDFNGQFFLSPIPLQLDK